MAVAMGRAPALKVSAAARCRDRAVGGFPSRGAFKVRTPAVRASWKFYGGGDRCNPSGGAFMPPADFDLRVDQLSSFLKDMAKTMQQRSDAFNSAPEAGRYSPQAAGEYPIPVDTAEDETSYVITADLPGIAKDDVQVKALPDDILMIQAERKRVEGIYEGGSRRKERRHGKFSRKLRLPKDADPDSIVASVRDGVLSITIAKKERVESDSREIPIL